MRRLRFESLETRRVLSITVDNPFDELDADRSPGDTSLREAIFDAITAGPSEDTINFDPIIMNGATINLLSGSGLGQLEIPDKTLTIDASMLSNGITIDAGKQNFRIFNITDSSNGAAPPLVTFKNLKLTGGDVGGNGGAINSRARLAIIDCVIEDNEAGNGGGIYVDVAGANLAARDELVLSNTTFELNTASADGGAIYIKSGQANAAMLQTTAISGCTFIDNMTLDGSGGAIFHSTLSANRLAIAGSGFYGNQANGFVNTSNPSGGAIYSTISSGSFAQFQDPGITIQDSVLSGNSSYADGGALSIHLGKEHAGLGDHVPALNLKLNITNSQISGNTAGNRGGGAYVYGGAGSTTSIVNSTISGNSAGLNLAFQSGFSAVQVGLNKHSGGGLYGYFFSGNNEVPGTGDFTARLNVSSSTFDSNRAGAHGGGIHVHAKRQDTDDNVDTGPFSTVGISNTTISGNFANAETHPTLNPNNGTGGGIRMDFFQASGGSGAADVEGIRARFHNVTITNNQAVKGGGIFSLVTGKTFAADNNDFNDTRLFNTIVSGNSTYSGAAASGNNLYGSFNGDDNNVAGDSYNNLFGDAVVGTSEATADPNNLIFDPFGADDAFFNSTASGNIFNATNNPLLAPLAFTGGPTRTHAPLPGSPVIDAGRDDKAVVPFGMTALQYDQRGEGFTRMHNIPGIGTTNTVDIGAHEVGLAKVVEVRLDRRGTGSDWAASAEVSFAERIAAGEQLRPIATQGANTIDIVFSEHVVFAAGPSPGVPDGHELTLRGLTKMVYDSVHDIFNPVTLELDEDDFTFVYNPNALTGTWAFDAPLTHDKFAIHLADSITNLAGQRLDSEWDNPDNGTPDIWGDDTLDGEYQSTFSTDNGTAGSMSGEFRFHFAYLPGDSDGDGIVEANPSGANDDLQPGVLGDIDGDGLSGTTADSTAAQSRNGNKLPLRTVGGGDLNDDEIVNGLDLAMWETGYAATTVGDVDGDGDSDGQDFLLWQQVSGFYTAWYGGGGGNFTALIMGAAPQVINVIISGSLSAHDPFSFDTVDGSGLQLRTVPVGGADTISILFSEDVNVSADKLRLIGLGTGNIPELAEFSYDPLTTTATWRFEGWALADHYLISIDDAVTDVDGNRLDGEWTNPLRRSTSNVLVSEFPSGDGEVGGDFNFVATLLPGDATLDGVVDLSDWYVLSANLAPSQLEKMFTQADFNGDGVVNVVDIQLFGANGGTDLQEINIASDLDGDFDVDNDDLMVVVNNHGMTGADYEDGDLNGDGVVSDADLDLVFAQMGLGLTVVT